MKTSELTGPALRWAVARALNYLYLSDVVVIGRYLQIRNDEGVKVPFEPDTDWSQGGPIIEREEMYVRPTGDAAKWSCYMWGKHPDDGVEQFIHEQYGPTPLVAAMRCFVASKLGDEVEVPLELL